jgi:hypothetical protein
MGVYRSLSEEVRHQPAPLSDLAHNDYRTPLLELAPPPGDVTDGDVDGPFDVPGFVFVRFTNVDEEARSEKCCRVGGKHVQPPIAVVAARQGFEKFPSATHPIENHFAK